MRATTVPLPDAVLDLHSHLNVQHVIRARLIERDLPFNGFGFFSWNDDDQYFIQMSRMIDYGNDGVERILLKTSKGKDLDEAIDLVVGYRGCGEVETPHIESVQEFRLDSKLKVSMTAEFVRGPSEIFYRNHHDMNVDLVLIMGFVLDGRMMRIESADTRLLDFWYWINRRIPRHV